MAGESGAESCNVRIDGLGVGLCPNLLHDGSVVCYDASNDPFYQLKRVEWLEALSNEGIRIAEELRLANVVVASTRGKLLRQLLHGAWGKLLVLYTEEPSFDLTFQPVAWLVPGVSRMRVLNAYTGSLYRDASYFLSHFGLDGPFPSWDMEAIRRKFETRRIATFFTCRSEKSPVRIVCGRNVDLNARRLTLAKVGREMGLVDIFGSGFPAGWAVAGSGWSSGNGEWWKHKLDLLTSRYAFNLCLENTAWPYYISEKIWQAIRGASLPIYCGRDNRIGEVFSWKCWIDPDDFPSERDLFHYVAEMSFDEYRKRLYECRAGAEQLLKRYLEGNTDNESMRIARFVHAIRDPWTTETQGT